MIKNKYPTTKPSLNLDFANTKSLDPRINFRRGTPGTYYDGVTHAKAEENLLSYSENFNDVDNYWAEVRATLTGSQASPIDSTSAYELSQTSTGLAGVLLVNENKIKLQIGKQYVSSVYVKASSSNYFAIAEEVSLGTGTPAFTYFDLSNDGEVMLNHENHIASIQNVGNQWYRCSIMFTAKLESDYTVMFYLDGGSSQSTISEPQNVTAGASIYLWGAQLEQRDSVTSYTATNGAPITKYQPKLMTASPDDARFDHDPITGESKGLLIEESRTNLISYSEDMSHTDWTKGSTSITSNIIIAPDGTLTGDKLVDSATDSVHNTSQTLALQAGVHTFSVYAKKAELKYMIMYDDTNVGLIVFNLENGTAPITAGSFTDYSISDVGNGWYKCVLVTSSFSAGNHKFMIYTNTTESGSSQHVGDGYSGFYIWGAQVEAGSFATSYIKTTGASATRSADNASIIGENFSSWYRQDEGSIYCEAAKMNPVTSVVASLNDGTSNNRIFINLRSGENFEVTKSNNQEVLSGYTGLNAETYYKIAACYKKDSAAMSLGGQNSLSDTDCEVPGVDRLLFSKNYSSNVLYDYSMYIKKLAYYPQRLTNEQLQNLTK